MEIASAMIFFTRSERAINAKEELLFKQVKGREMGLAHYDRVRVRQDQANVFIKGLSETETNMSLYNLFRTYGEIFSSKLAVDSKGKPKGYGFVQYTSPEIAAKVVAEANGKEHNERKLLVAPYRRRDRNVAVNFNNLYVKNLPESVTTKEALDALFASYGERVSVGIGQSTFKEKTGYFGFVCFKEPAAAANALKEMNGKTVDGAVLCVAKALTKEQREREKRRLLIEYREKVRMRTLYVKSIIGMPLDEEKVREQLGAFGTVTRVTVHMVKDDKGNMVNSPVAFVVFEKEQDLQRALTEYVGENKILAISRLERREERRARMNRERMDRRVRNGQQQQQQDTSGRGMLEDFYRQVYRHLNDGPRMLGEFLMARRYTNYILGVGQRESGLRHRQSRPYGYFNRTAGYGPQRQYS